MMHKRVLFLFIPFITTLSTPVLAANSGVKKCQDANGVWHYGNTASMACAKTSTITEISTESGIERVVQPPQPTAAELNKLTQEKEEQAKQKAIAEERARQDQLLLSSYANEADLIYVRDRKLAQLEANTNASEETLKSLRATLVRIEERAAEEQKSGELSPQTAKTLEQSRSQTAKHEAAVAAIKKEQEAVRDQYNSDLQRFRQLKQGSKIISSNE